jgi:DNA repair exonuclease SbcCD ATPase subunit
MESSMALSNNPKETISTYHVLLEIGQRLKELVSDPEALDKMTVAAFALADAEKSKAQEARDTISKYESLVAEQQKREEGLRAYESRLADERKNLDKTQADQITRNRELNTREEALNVASAKLAAERMKYDADREALNEATRTQQKEANKLAEERKQVQQHLDQLKERAEKIKDLTEGL